MVVDQTWSYYHYRLNVVHFLFSPMIIFLLLFFPAVDLVLFCMFFLSIKSLSDFNGFQYSIFALCYNLQIIVAVVCTLCMISIACFMSLARTLFVVCWPVVLPDLLA